MSLGPNDVEMIIPTVMIPLTLITVGISVVASFIASLFGIELKTEGPKKLLEVLLKPRVLVSAVLLNVLIWGGVKGFLWVKNYPRFLSTIQKQQEKIVLPSEKKYTNNSLDVNAVLRIRNPRGAEVSALEEAWHFDTKTGVFSTPVVSSSSVFVGNRGGFVSELDLETGKLIRSFYIGSPVTPKLSIWKNALYAGEGVHDLHHARLYKFNLATGELEATYQTKGHIEAQSVVSSYKESDLVFIPSGIDGLHAVDANTLEERWSANYGHCDAAVAVSGSRVFMGTGREKNDDKKNKTYAVAMDFESGNLLWKHELPASSWMTPVVADKNVCFVAGEIYFSSERGHIVCFDQVTGDHTLAFNVESPIASMPLLLGSDLIVSTIEGNICSFSLDKKEKNWCNVVSKTDGLSFAGPSYDATRDVIVYPSYDKGLFILSPDSGEILSSWAPSVTQGEWKKNYAGVAIRGAYYLVSDYMSTLRAIKNEESFTKIKKQASIEAKGKAKAL